MGSAGTLLHLAVELRLKQFAAQLLANSSGAYSALQTKSKGQMTPIELATARGDGNFVQLFADYKACYVNWPMGWFDYFSLGFGCGKARSSF